MCNDEKGCLPYKYISGTINIKTYDDIYPLRFFFTDTFCFNRMIVYSKKDDGMPPSWDQVLCMKADNEVSSYNGRIYKGDPHDLGPVEEGTYHKGITDLLESLEGFRSLEIVYDTQIASMREKRD